MGKKPIVIRLQREQVDEVLEILSSAMDDGVEGIRCGYSINENIDYIRKVGKIYQKMDNARYSKTDVIRHEH